MAQALQEPALSHAGCDVTFMNQVAVCLCDDGNQGSVFWNHWDLKSEYYLFYIVILC